MNVKVGDFGLAALIETPGDRKKCVTFSTHGLEHSPPYPLRTICGTPNYIAPEVLFDTANGHSFEVDTWSIGVILSVFFGSVLCRSMLMRFSRYTLLIGKPPFQTSDVKSIYERIKNNSYEFPPNKPISPDAQALITDILTHDPKKRPTLHQIIDHDFFSRSIFPPSIPISAHEYPPTFSSVTRQQSRVNYARVRRAALLDAEDTEIRTVDIVDSGSQLDAATAQQQQKQEREFHKAVQPGSPISVLLRSAREPLMVSKSPLRVSHHASENRPPPPPPPTNALLRKLSAAAPASSASLLSTGSTPFPALPRLNDEDVALSTATATTERHHHRRPRSTTAAGTGMPPPSKKDAKASPTRQPLQALPTLQEEQNEARRQYDLASQKARIVTQMAGEDEDGESNRRNARGKEREQRDRRDHSQHVTIPVGKGLAEDETESIKPIRETPRKQGKQKAAANRKFP